MTSALPLASNSEVEPAPRVTSGVVVSSRPLPSAPIVMFDEIAGVGALRIE